MKKIVYIALIAMMFISCSKSTPTVYNSYLGGDSDLLVDRIVFTVSDIDGGTLRDSYTIEHLFDYDDYGKLTSVSTQTNTDKSEECDKYLVMYTDNSYSRSYIRNILDKNGFLYNIRFGSLVKYTRDDDEYEYEYDKKNQLVRLTDFCGDDRYVEEYIWRDGNMSKIIDDSSNAVTELYYYPNVDRKSICNPDLQIINYYTSVEHNFILPINGHENKNLLKSYQYFVDGAIKVRFDNVYYEVDNKGRVVCAIFRKYMYNEGVEYACGEYRYDVDFLHTKNLHKFSSHHGG